MNKQEINSIGNNGDWTGMFSYAEHDITPPIGIYSRNWGAAKLDNATGIHKPLLLQCLIFGENDENQRILIAADLGWWKNADDELILRREILSCFGLHESQLIFCLSHTHAGPSISSTDRDLPGGELIKPYLDFIKDTSILCIQQAKNKLKPANLSWAAGTCSLAKNRDLEVDEEYLIGYNPRGEADQTLLVGRFTDLEGNPIAAICNYACHPTSFAHENTLISPDFVGSMRELINNNKNIPVVFLQGASGDLAPRKQYVSDPNIVDANGRELGYAVLSTLEAMDAPNTNWELEEVVISGAPLALWKEKEVYSAQGLFGKVINVTVPYKKLSSIEDIIVEYEACEDRTLKERIWRKLSTRKSIGDKENACISIWIWKIGSAFVVAQPNEAYSLYQQSVRAAFPSLKIVFINIANGYVGYLPPSKLYVNDMYAVWQSPYAQGALEILIGETIKEIKTYLD